MGPPLCWHFTGSNGIPQIKTNCPLPPYSTYPFQHLTKLTKYHFVLIPYLLSPLGCASQSLHAVITSNHVYKHYSNHMQNTWILNHSNIIHNSNSYTSCMINILTTYYHIYIHITIYVCTTYIYIIIYVTCTTYIYIYTVY